MLAIRRSPDGGHNDALQEVPAKRRESNRRWLERVEAREGLLLLGGASVVHFRIRVAQSHARRDLSPSLWSQVGLLVDRNTFLSVPLSFPGDGTIVPQANGIQTCKLADYDDPAHFPNLAVVRFASDHGAILDNAERLKAQRSVVDLPTLMVAWLGFVWGAGQAGNPLLDGKGLPSAVFAETVFGIAGVELTPGLSSTSSCPEAIWQSAKWWREFYAVTARQGRARSAAPGHAASIVPQGAYTVRQPAAAVLDGAGV
jgi:hypothetical protein